VPGEGDRAWRRLAVLAGAVALASSAYFVQGGGANQDSRLDLTRAIVEQGTLAIDSYHRNTFDKSERDGRHYSDKAPGLSFLAVPVYAAWVAVAGPPAGGEGTSLPLWWATVATVGFATAVAAGMLVGTLRRLGAGPAAAFLAAVAWALGTPAFGYATLFVSHQLVGALLAIALALLLHPAGGRSRLAVAGLVAGTAAVSEYPSAGIALMLAAFAWHGRGRAAWAFAAAALPPVAGLMAYNTACFGSPFAIGYSSLSQPEFQASMGRGFFGIGVPDPAVAGELLVGEFRGLLPLAPWLAMAVLGLVVAVRNRASRAAGVLCVAAFAFLLAVASGYAVWNGGASMGPRHLAPALPFVASLAGLGLDAAFRLRRGRTAATAVAGALVAASIATCTATVAVMPELPDAAAPVAPGDDIEVRDPRHPLTTFVAPLFLRGRLSVKAVQGNGAIGLDCWLPGHERDAYNAGEAAGLKGLASLAPLWLGWVAAAWLAVREVRRAAARAGG
jgi:hypothetical protein